MARTLQRRPMTLMVLSPLADRIHMALMTGATAAAMGRPVSYFFSKAAARFLTAAGRATLATSEGLSLAAMDTALEDKGVAGTDTLLDGIAAMDVRFIVCESALREQGIDRADLILRPATEIGGLADLIEKGEGGDWLTF